MKKSWIKRKVKSKSQLKELAWKLTSIHVRSKDADWRGFNYCYTCGVRKHWKELQCGHYIHARLDYELNNLRPKCQRCNKWLHGNSGIYGEKLIKELGLKVVEKMRLYSYKKGNDYSRTELLAIIKKYE